MKISHVLAAVIMAAWFGQLGRAAADTVKTLHTFTGSTDGAQPYGGLTLGNDGNYYGTTKAGGGSGLGTVFSITGAGTLSTIHSFGASDGSNPEAGLIQGSDNSFYGTTFSGGNVGIGAGTVFKIDAMGNLTSLHSFTGVADGGSPQAGIVQGSDNNYYGATSTGGTGGAGTLFTISTSGQFTTRYPFTGGLDGGSPRASLVQGSDGFLYGTTYSGGTSNAGTVFRFSIADGLTTLYSFTGGVDGANPLGNLVEGTNGNFFGTTSTGGEGFGTVFRISTTGGSMGNLTVRWVFAGTSDGGNPKAGLIIADDGNFYGTTTFGGNRNAGTVFKIGTSGGLTTVYNFSGGNDGGVPLGGVIQASSTNFLGTTSADGQDSLGTVFNLLQPCTFSVSPSHVTLAGVANSGTFAVTASGTDCVWTATSSVDWISITSSNSGLGDGVVGYTVTVNSNGTSRTGNIAVGGKSFSLTQEGEVFGAFLPGTYNGLVMDAIAPVQASSGSISVSLGNTGSFKANVNVAGVKSAFNGQFDQSGNATNTVVRKNLSSLTVILQVAAVSNSTDQIMGTVSDGVFTAQVLANLAVFSKVTPSPWVGNFTFALAPTNSNDTTVPQGYGYGTLAVMSTGSGSLKGVLGDGTKISGKFPVSGYGTWPLYNSLYKNGGACIGWVTLADDNTVSGTVYWFKAASAVPFYPAGFSTVLSAAGDIYVSPSSGGPSVAATGQLTLGGGNLTSNIVISVSFAANGAGTVSPAGSNGLKLKIQPTKGQLSGSFLSPTSGKAIKFNGLLLQNSGDASGYFLGTNESGFVTFVPE